MKTLLNVGCGQCVHPNWVNLDIVALVPGVVEHDVRKGLPFPGAACDAVYHSHVLEHFGRSEAGAFLDECRRVLKPEGILRVVVPDLEDIARNYLNALDDQDAVGPLGGGRLDWMIVELIDQFVRERGGGEMLEFIREADPGLWPFITERVGADIVALALNSKAATPLSVGARSWISGIWHGLWCCGNLIREPYRMRELLIKRLLTREYALLELGRFRHAGEVHHWMYDRKSLATLLEQVGFISTRLVAHDESNIPGWSQYRLDSQVSGLPRKPHSIYMECSR